MPICHDADNARCLHAATFFRHFIDIISCRFVALMARHAAAASHAQKMPMMRAQRGCATQPPMLRHYALLGLPLLAFRALMPPAFMPPYAMPFC